MGGHIGDRAGTTAKERKKGDVGFRTVGYYNTCSVLNSRKNYFPDFLSSCVFVFLFICVSVFLPFCLFVILSLCLSVFLSLCLSVIVSFCHSSSLVHLSFLNFNNTTQSGCVIEDQMNYRIHNLDNVTNPTTQESPQACAEHSAASEGGRFWTYNKENKACWLKTSDSKRTYLAHAISGSRACGLSKQLVLSD